MYLRIINGVTTYCRVVTIYLLCKDISEVVFFSRGVSSAGEERVARHVYCPAWDMWSELKVRLRKTCEVCVVSSPTVNSPPVVTGLPSLSSHSREGVLVSPLTVDATQMRLYSSPASIIPESLTATDRAVWGTAGGVYVGKKEIL